MPKISESPIPESALDTFHELQARRRSEIHARQGRLVTAHDDPQQAVAEYRRFHDLHESEPVIGTFARLIDGQPSGQPQDIATALASACELKRCVQAPQVDA